MSKNNTTAHHNEPRQVTDDRSDTHEVDPARLAPGEWSHDLGRTIGEGDIHASYSADKIGMGQPVRRPFVHRGAAWVCVGIEHGQSVAAHAYGLMHPDCFDGQPVTYEEKTAPDGGKAARSDPLGFYHGITIQRGQEIFVLCGPPVRFIACPPRQLSLFG